MSALAQEATSPKQIGRELRGFAPFPPTVIICWDQVGVTPAINTLGELQEQEGQQMGWAIPQTSFYLQTECSSACFAKVNPVCLK